MNIFLISVAWWTLQLCLPSPTQKTSIKISENSEGLRQISRIGAFLIILSSTIAHKSSSGSLGHVDKMLVEMNMQMHWISNAKNAVLMYEHVNQNPKIRWVQNMSQIITKQCICKIISTQYCTVHSVYMYYVRFEHIEQMEFRQLLIW